MTQETIKVFVNEIFSKPPKKIVYQPMFILLMTFGV